jgi:RNA polymerase sigma-70 factor (ECF subfamily)
VRSNLVRKLDVDDAPEATAVDDVEAENAAANARGEPSQDRRVMERMASGEVEALQSLYERYAPRAMAIALRILRNQQEAEDVVQETFLDLWRRSAQFDGTRGTAYGWVATIARSRAIDRLRTYETSGRALAMDDVISTEAPSPAEVTEGRWDQARVALAMEALPAEQRETIQLAYFEGLSQSEIAIRTGSPLGTVKMRVKLAIAKLAALLKEEEV